MNEIKDLAKQLGNMGIFRATFDVDLRDYLFLKDTVDNAFESDPTTITAKLDGHQDKMEFFLQIYGVKMLIKCRNARLEIVKP